MQEKEPKKEAQNENEGMEEKPKQDLETKGSVDIPEEAQKEIHALVHKHKHSKPTLKHMQGKVQDAIDEHMDKEMEAKSNKENKVPNAFSTDSMPG